MYPSIITCMLSREEPKHQKSKDFFGIFIPLEIIVIIIILVIFLIIIILLKNIFSPFLHRK